MLHPEIAELADLVAKWADLLKRYHGKNDWIEWLENDVRYLRNSDFYGVEHLLSAFGGMGSIADSPWFRSQDLCLVEVERDSLTDVTAV